MAGEAHVTIGSVGAEASPPREDAAPMKASGDRSADYTGLCQNCALRFTCGLPKPEGGVWRCQYYK